MAISNAGNLNAAVADLLTQDETKADTGFMKKKKGENQKNKMVWLGFSVYSLPGKRGIMTKWEKEWKIAAREAKEEIEKNLRNKLKGKTNDKG